KPGYAFFTDSEGVADSDFIPDLLKNAPQATEEDIRTAPQIVADDTRIHMFTSGSTGKPKDVIQRMTEFNEDNAFVFSKWGAEFQKRKLVATVSQHHIYGFLFTIALPFAAGVPFRRKRIEIPNEFEKLSDERYIIIAVPAFLKRTNEAEEKLPLNDCFIFTSGGVLLPEVAKRTNEVFGFWPVEVYGSTETSGIAYRQSKNGLEWTPFDNAQIWKNEDGCLVIKSPYIKDPAGFATADLVDIHSDGRFILKGRADSIVKIEEKRVSLAEVENRLLQSGLVRDVCVVAMNDRRQYLAAAIQFNDEGKKKFEGAKKFDINMFFHDYLMDFFENVVIPKKWRFLDALPSDLQGKHKKLEIQALFAKEE
ncbi:MAG: acyl--CoA ligase, partial [Treponema sp.]|nr:acyl--CoA ligase [Treponema sp.]